MFVADTGQLAINFNEEGVSTSGSMTKALRRPSEMTAARSRAVATILGMASSKAEPVGIIVSKVLSQSIPELQSFVQARGEAPADTKSKLAVQAALLRAMEIGLVSKAIDTTDNDALLVIEDSEQQHVEDNTADSTSILSPDTSGALALLVDRISKRFKQNGGSGKMVDFVAAMKKANTVDNFNSVSAGNLVNNSTGGGMIFYTPEQEEAVTGTVTQTGTSSGGSFWDNLFSNIDNIVDGITKVSGAVNTTVGNVQNTAGGILDQVTNVGGAIGASSIEQYLAANWLKVVGVVIAIIIVTIIIARAGRNK